MDQKITIKIAERKYALSASSPEKEALIRTAAEGINKKLETLSASMPGRSELDKITMIALNLSITSLSQQREIEALIEQQQVRQRFILLGERGNPYPYYQQCDIYVQPSRFEGKSIAVDEAKCFARPIVVTDFGTVRDQIEDGVDGLIAPISPQGIADAVQRLLCSPQLRQTLSDNLQEEKTGNEEEIEKLYALL